MKRRLFVLAGVVLAGAGAAWGLLAGAEGPSYAGRDVAEWRADLRSADEARRLRARDRLRRGGAEAVPVLVALGRGRALEVTVDRIFAAVGPEAVPPLVAALRDGPVEDRTVAADGLGAVGYGHPAARRALVDALSDEDAGVRAAAARSLARAGEPEAEILAALGARFVDPDARVRHEAAWAHYRLARAVETVLPVFLDGLRGPADDFFRAAFVVEELGPLAAPVVPELVRRLDRGDPVTWGTTCRLLYRIGPSAASAAAALERRLAPAPPRDPDYDPEEWERLTERTRVAAACALLVVDPGRPAGRAAVDRILVTGAPLARVAALRAVWRAGADRDRVLAGLPDLLSNPESAGAVVRLVAEVGPPATACVPALADRLTDPDEARDAALALAAIGPGAEAAAPALRRALETAPLHVRGAAAYALWGITGRADEAVAALREVVEGATGRDQEAGYGAVALLARMARESGRARRALRDVSREAAWPARLAATKALDVIGREE